MGSVAESGAPDGTRAPWLPSPWKGAWVDTWRVGRERPWPRMGCRGLRGVLLVEAQLGGCSSAHAGQPQAGLVSGNVGQPGKRRWKQRGRVCVGGWRRPHLRLILSPPPPLLPLCRA